MDNQHVNNKDEISIKDIILTVKEYAIEVIKNWLLVAAFISIVTAYFTYKHLRFVPKYDAETRFLVEGNTGSGGLGGILGQFGLKGGGKFNPFKVVEVAKSKELLSKAFFQKYDNDFIINKLISVYKLDEIWSKNNPEWKAFRFKHTEVAKFDTKESQAFMRIYSMTIGGIDPSKNLLSFNYNDNSSIFKYNISTNDEKLSLELISASYENLRQFFEEEILKNQVGTTLILKQKADSIQNLIKRKSYQLAGQQDQTYGLIRNTPAASKAILEKEITALTMAYAEVIKSYEISDIGLKDTKAMFLKLDQSLSPLEPTGSNLIIEIIKAIIIGVLLSIGYIILRKIVREAMAG
jgi:hypothetical protein